MGRRTFALLVAAATTVAMAAPAQATYPGRNGSLVFTSRYSDGEPVSVSLHRLSPRSGADRGEYFCNVYEDPPKRCNLTSAAALSPDGRRVAVLFANGFVPSWDAALRVASLDGARDTTVDVADPFPFSWFEDGGAGVRWLPTGDRFSVELSDGTTRELGLDGSLGHEVLPRDSSQLDWAIDGRVAYVSHGDLYDVEPAWRGRRLTFRGGVADPCWSPHGRWIAFTRAGGLFVVPSRGGTVRRLPPRDVHEPVWSPDGRFIAFVRRGYNRINERLGETTFYLYGWRAKHTRRLTGPIGGEDTELSPAEWQPLPR